MGVRPSLKGHRVTGAKRAGLDHAVEPAATAISHHGAQQMFIVKAQSEFEAGLARLADLQHHRPGAKNIADANRGLIEVPDRQVFAEAAWNEQRSCSGKSQNPNGIARQRITINGLVGSAMNREIGLLIAFKAELPNVNGSIHHMFHKAARHALRTKRSHPSCLNGNDACRCVSVDGDLVGIGYSQSPMGNKYIRYEILNQIHPSHGSRPAPLQAPHLRQVFLSKESRLTVGPGGDGILRVRRGGRELTH